MEAKTENKHGDCVISLSELYRKGGLPPPPPNNVGKDQKPEARRPLPNGSARAPRPPHAGPVSHRAGDGGSGCAERGSEVSFRGSPDTGSRCCLPEDIAPSRARCPALPLCPPPPPRCPPRARLPHPPPAPPTHLSTAQEKGFLNADVNFRAQCQKWGRPSEDAHGGDPATAAPPGSGHN